MSKNSIRTSTDAKREFLKAFSRLAEIRSSWGVWSDFVTVSASSIANAVDKRPEVWHERENEYISIMKKYNKTEQDALIELFAMTVIALDKNPAQDFLGNLYMELGLSNHWKGQFFTPMPISDLMARLVVGDDLKEKIQKEGYISVGDFACGAGCMLIAFANACKEQNVNYQHSVLFVGQDVDPIAAKMAYIQLSLLGCPGYIVVGNTLTEPVGGTVLNPSFHRPNDIWFTPFYYKGLLTWRLIYEQSLDLLKGSECSIQDARGKSLPVFQIGKFLKEKGENRNGS